MTVIVIQQIVKYLFNIWGILWYCGISDCGIHVGFFVTLSEQVMWSNCLMTIATTSLMKVLQ